MLYDLLTEKNIGINSLRSSYISHWVPKLNANQVQRVAYLMRTSGAMVYKNYLKKDEPTSIPTLKTTLTTTQPEPKKIVKLTTEQKQKYKRNRLEYNKNTVILKKMFYLKEQRK